MHGYPWSHATGHWCVASDMWCGNADTHACVYVQEARIPSQDAAYTLATLDDLCTVCNTCQFIPLRVNYNISRYHTCSHAAHSPKIAFQCVASDMWRGNADTHACVCIQDTRIPSHTPQFDDSLANHPFFKYALTILRCHLVD